MMSAARNHISEICQLLDKGARVLQEDDRGCTAVCYAAAAVQQKHIRRPHNSIDYLTAKFLHVNNPVQNTWRSYVRRRLELLVTPPDGQLNSFHDVTNRIIAPVLVYFSQNLPDGPDVLLELNIFGRLSDAIETHLHKQEYINSLLAILAELLRCCPCCFGCGITAISPSKMADSFVKSGTADSCLRILERTSSIITIHATLIPIYFAASQDGIPDVWLRDNYPKLSQHYSHNLENCSCNCPNHHLDDVHLDLVRKKLKRARVKFQELQKEFDAYSTKSGDDQVDSSTARSDSVDDKKYSSKKMRRKAKALKAKIDKIRRADVVERANCSKVQDPFGLIKDEDEDILEVSLY